MFDFIMYIINSTCNTPCRYMIYDIFMKQGLCEHRLFLNIRKCIEYHALNIVFGAIPLAIMNFLNVFPWVLKENN